MIHSTKLLEECGGMCDCEPRSLSDTQREFSCRKKFFFCPPASYHGDFVTQSGNWKVHMSMINRTRSLPPAKSNDLAILLSSRGSSEVVIVRLRCPLINSSYFMGFGGCCESRVLTCWLAFAGRLRCLVDEHELCKLIRIINDPIGNLLEL